MERLCVSMSCVMQVVSAAFLMVSDAFACVQAACDMPKCDVLTNANFA